MPFIILSVDELNKRIVIHVGPPKTGSSAIQFFFNENRNLLEKNGVLYPKHPFDKNKISSGNARAICKNDSNGRLELDIRKLNKVVKNFRTNDAFHTLFLSSESFFRIMDSIIEFIPEVEIIGFIRNPVEFQLSIYNQSVKRHSNTEKLNVRKILDFSQWDKFLQLKERKGNFKLFTFLYKSYNEPGNIVEDVLSVLKLNGKIKLEKQQINISYSFESLEIKRYLNGFDITAIQQELDQFLQRKSEHSTDYRLLSDEDLASYTDQIQRGYTKYDCLLSETEWKLISKMGESLYSKTYKKQGLKEGQVKSILESIYNEKPFLFFRIVNIIRQNSSYSPLYSQLTELQKMLLPVIYFGDWCRAMVVNFKRRNKLDKRPASIDGAVKLFNITLVPQAKGSNPGRVVGGLKGKNIPDFAYQLRCENTRSKSLTPQIVSDIEFINSFPECQNAKEGVFFYGGPIFNNFGHYLAESIHRLSSFHELKEQVPNAKVIFQPQRYIQFLKIRKHTLPPHFYETLDYLGIKKKDVLIQKHPFKVKQLYVSRQQSFFRSRQPISKEYKDFLLSCERRANLNNIPKSDEKIYVSRVNYLLRGAYAGELYLEQMFKRLGFKIVYPENLALIEQLAIYKQAKEIVFAEGAALNVLELLGNISAKISVFQRRVYTKDVFFSILQARCNEFDFLSDVHELPSLFVPKKQVRAAHGSAISILDGDKLSELFKSRYNFESFDVTSYHKAVVTDLVKYHRAYSENLKNNNLKGIEEAFIAKLKLYLKEGVIVDADKGLSFN
ncbi:glycosyltransferase family 61 protein [Glaciecola sp. 1036]|uniref:glycosyltransferase family 61 protein n=1 Tax=Alteromonadaceae TaxID=72275 RepID=UPI003D03B790